jgi:hypothetical protein
LKKCSYVGTPINYGKEVYQVNIILSLIRTCSITNRQTRDIPKKYETVDVTVKKNTSKKYETKELFSYVLLF